MKSQTIQESRWVGRVLRDKWRIDGRIARGGMGTVFVATHKNNGSTAAIKILHPEFSRDSDTLSRFLQEGYAANQVNHPGVVRILDDDVTEEGFAYLVMELLDGELLEQRRIRKGGKLPLVEVYEIADQLLDVLASAHARGIVHRDIKPDNLFLTTQGRLKVLDFGFAQMRSTFRTEQTATGFLLGTPGFMSPEQATGNRKLIDAQTDIWAVGATMFILLTGQPCHAGESAAEMLVAAANFPVRSVTTLEPHVPTKLAYVIDRALAFHKSERWPDARSMQAALRAVPGRQIPNDPIRRSIVDDERRLDRTEPEGAPLHEDATVMENIEELDTDEIRDRSERSVETLAATYAHPADREGPTTAYRGGRGGQRGDGVRGGAPLFGAVSEHAPTGYAHPADQENPTVFVQGDGPTLNARTPQADEHTDATLVMEGRPGVPAMPRPPSPVGSTPQVGGLSPRISYPDSFPHPNAEPSSGEVHRHSDPQMMFVGGGARPATRPLGGSRVLVFLLVAGITMVVVILTGLLVILGLD